RRAAAVRDPAPDGRRRLRTRRYISGWTAGGRAVRRSRCADRALATVGGFAARAGLGTPVYFARGRPTDPFRSLIAPPNVSRLTSALPLPSVATTRLPRCASARL